MEIHVQLKRWHLAVLAMLVAAVVGSVAYASIPDAGGVYTACKLNATGTIRLIDPALGSSSLLGHCTSIESKLTWSKTGPSGVSPLVAQLPAGDSHCPAGGASIADGSGNTAYVCNGRPFTGSFQSPNGQYSLQVSDQGVGLSGPGSAVSLTGGTLDLSSTQQTVEVGGNRTESVGGDETLSVGGTRTENVGGDESIAVGGSQTTNVAANESATIGADRSEQVGQDETVVVAGDSTQKVHGDETVAVAKTRLEDVSGNETVKVGGSKTEQDGGNYVHEASGNFTLKSGGDGQVESGGTLTFKAAIINSN